MNNKVLYIGGFELPDHNAAAQRVVGVAKTIRDLGYEVFFLNALTESVSSQPVRCKYFGFDCFEYKRENDFVYLFRGDVAISYIQKLMPAYVIAYNYPAVALSRVQKFCKKSNIKCISDITEWYEASGNFVRKAIKQFDVNLRMKSVLFKMDGIIAISRYLYDQYQTKVPTVIVPPTVDCGEEKWQVAVDKNSAVTSFVYAGSPSATKEKLDIIYDAVCAVSQSKNVVLNVIGITHEQFCRMYGREHAAASCVCFWGRVPHKKVVELVSQADWAVIIRERSRVVDAGFPTKLVESISCGTPVIVNPFSNILDYLDDSNSLVTEVGNLEQTIENACARRIFPRKDQFDYHFFVQTMEVLFPRISD